MNDLLLSFVGLPDWAISLLGLPWWALIYLLAIPVEAFLLPLLEVVVLGRLKSYHPARFVRMSAFRLVLAIITLPLSLILFPALLVLWITMKFFIPFPSLRRKTLETAFR